MISGLEGWLEDTISDDLIYLVRRVDAASDVETYVHLGTGQGTKTDEFSENFQGGGWRSFSNQKITLQIFWTFIQGFKEGFWKKIAM